MNDHECQIASIINHLFKQLSGIFPAWRQAYPNQQQLNEARSQWVKGFIENDIKYIAQIEFGLKKARTINSAFVPSVGQFITWCHDKDFPTDYDAWVEACNHAHDPKTHDWSHIAVKLAGNKIGWNMIRGFSDQDKVKEAFQVAYRDLRNTPLKIENNPINRGKATRVYHDKRFVRDLGSHISEGRNKSLERLKKLGINLKR